MAAAGSSNSGPAPKVPEHFWWTKRIFLAWLLLVAAVLASRFVWGWEAQRRFDREMAAITAHGESLDWTKLAPSELAPEHNAATYYRRAAEAIEPDAEMLNFTKEDATTLTLRRLSDTRIASWLQPNLRALADCRLARKAKGVNWRTHQTKRAPNGYHSPINLLNVRHIWVAGHRRVYIDFDDLSYTTIRTDLSSPVDSVLGADSIKYARGMFGQVPPAGAGVGGLTSLANSLCLKALWQAKQEGNTAAIKQEDSIGAIETILDMDALARAVGQDSLLPGQEQSMLMHILAARAVEWSAPRLSGVGQPNASQAVRKLIGVLLDGHSLPTGREALVARRAYDYPEVEGMSMADAFGCCPSVDPVMSLIPNLPDACGWPLAPMMLCDKARWLRTYGRVIEAADKLSDGRAAIIVREMPCLSPNPAEALSHVLSSMLDPGLVVNAPEAILLSREAEATNRLAAAALALRLYELEKGHPANSLSELVPEYLRAVPGDPFDPAGGPIRARLTDDKPRIYSLGQNMKDDGGVGYIPPPLGHPNDPTRPDIVFHLRAEDLP